LFAFRASGKSRRFHPARDFVILSEVVRFAGESDHEVEGPHVFPHFLWHIQAFSAFSIVPGE